MPMDRGLVVFVLAAAVLVGFASASPVLSGSAFQGSTGSTGRSLLQAKKSCPVNFEFQNYTIITSKCKGPQFPPKECCDAFKEFACPFSDYINDESNDCASTMFSYINLYGKYPPGLFASECRDDKKGLSCAGVTQKETATANAGQQAQNSLLALIILAFGLVALLSH
ncbi:hypothetical protein GUJ93_ZPchr0006g45605 [Zizania palustris]|uniref:GPI-anchored protein LLG1-like domain-containing protein n=1 Tax=Zizania palustris TaxID=103762 RepID=A0A8J5SAJ4_ZIZPA|nr:hypothetical protein GUJ93_ZPchr0006g45605 [Zizania palustris]